MIPTAVLESARNGRLYPGVILHGGDAAKRLQTAAVLARALLCTAEPRGRPCGVCVHCRRIEVPGKEARFHPDVLLLERDLKTSTSVEATKETLKAAALLPFEARGQVFWITAAETLSGAAANALLKNLEEPGLLAPRHFLLLAPAASDLLPTLRSRCLSVYLGSSAVIDLDQAEELAGELLGLVRLFADSGALLYLQAMARTLHGACRWDDPRDEKPWSLCAQSLLLVAKRSEAAAVRPALLQLAQDLLEAGEMRLRGIAASRILEGLVARRLQACP